MFYINTDCEEAVLFFYPLAQDVITVLRAIYAVSLISVMSRIFLVKANNNSAFSNVCFSIFFLLYCSQTCSLSFI